MSAAEIVNKVWNYAHVLRDDDVGYGDYVEQITYLIFLKMADEQLVLFNENSADFAQDGLNQVADVAAPYKSAPYQRVADKRGALQYVGWGDTGTPNSLDVVVIRLFNPTCGVAREWR